jgi:GntR family transcriptional regulator
MQFWFARGSDVSIREQLVTQVVLGILSDDLAPGQRLPSTRELARRFHLHPNTISAGYRQLPALRVRLRQWLELQPPDHFLLIEPDEELRKILAAEIARAVTFPARSCGLDDCPKAPDGAIPVALPNRVVAVRKLLPAGIDLLELQIRSVPTSLAGYLPAPSGALVGVASRWPEFLKVSRAVLNAAGFHPDSLVFRDAREDHWQRGLKQSTAVVCDLLTAAELPAGCRAIAFSLLSEASIAELRRYEEFIRNPMQSPMKS